jgi:signal transduction histidine kinase
MKYIFYLVIFLRTLSVISYAQTTGTKTVEYYLKNANQDTSGVSFLLKGAVEFSFNNPDSGMILAKAAVDLSRKINYSKGEVSALTWYAEAFHFLGDYPQALNILFNVLELNQNMKDTVGEAETRSFIGMAYNELGQYKQALEYLLPSIQIFEQLHNKYEGSFELANIGRVYHNMNMPDSAIYYQRKAYAAYIRYPTGIHLKSFILQAMGDAYALMGVKDSAMEFYQEAIDYAKSLNDKLNLSTTQKSIAELFQSHHQYDSAIYFARMSLENARSISSKRNIMEAGNLLTELYKEKHNTDSAFFYLNITASMKDSLYGPGKFRQMQLLMLEQQQKQNIIERQGEHFRNRIRYTILITGIFAFFILSFFLWRNNQNKRKSNALLQKEKQNVEQAFNELKITQAQLIQSEKMASLGVLTAGIAHEIQNPLNFVNNFSEVNNELIEELKSQKSKLKTEEQDEMLNDIFQNNEKINHHGKRADAIVKGMLQHSRSSSGVKEPTDINSLCDEYLRLAYHGLRAKDKSFNATMKTDFDESIGNINIVQQDIGRVVLNLINNAFYVVDEKKKQIDVGYEPTVSVSTKKINSKVEIKVADNGNGIPQKVLDKIFQPFFTTKPTGQGTGLGLSLSYDIVKAHGGELKVETKEGKGSEFIILLPY